MRKKRGKKLSPFDFLVKRLREEHPTICTDPVRGISALEGVIREAEAYAAGMQPPKQVPPPPSPAKVLEILNAIQEDMKNPVGYPPPDVCERRAYRREGVLSALRFAAGTVTGPNLRAWTRGDSGAGGD